VISVGVASKSRFLFQPIGRPAFLPRSLVVLWRKGFDFLGQNVRKYPNGKLLIKPSKKNIKAFLDGFRGNLKAALGMSAVDLINWLNPKIRGWPNYHRHVVSSRVF
jgi:RNA-directed DNA polymerase